MRVMKLVKQVTFSALLVAATHSHQMLSQSQSSSLSLSSNSSAASDTPTIAPSTTPTETPIETPTTTPIVTPTETPTTTPTLAPTPTPTASLSSNPTSTSTPSATPVATEERYLKRQENEHPHPNPVSHLPKYTRASALVPVTPRPTPESTGTEGKRHKSDDESRPKARGPRVLRGNNEKNESRGNEEQASVQDVAFLDV